MSKEDLLLQEVQGEVRSADAFALLKKYRWFFIGGAVLIVAGVAGADVLRSQAESKRITQTQNLNLAIESGLSDTSLFEGERGVVSPLSQLVEAKTLVRKGDVEGAIALYDSVIADAKSDVERELARLSRFEIDDNNSPGALVNEGAIFRVEALLIQSQKLLANGETSAALDIASKLRTDPEAGDHLALIENFILSNGGQLDAVDPNSTEEENAAES